jgi:RHS repeat-associated protein
VCGVVITGSGPRETVSSVATDGLGSVSEALSSSGTVTAQQLDGPYGAGRYASGSMPTAKGYTGQYADAASSGLDDYQARSYDAVLGQFASAESDAAGGLNRYASVHGNPETATDPTGHYRCDETGCSRGHHNHGRGGCTYDCGSGDGHDGGNGGRKPPTQRRKGWNGCYAGDLVCQGALAQAEANRIYKQLTDELKEKLGDIFQHWLAKFNPFLILRDEGLDKFLSWLGGEGAKLLWALITRDGEPAVAFSTVLIAWGLALDETQHDAAWFQNPDNIVTFGHEEQQQMDIQVGALLLLMTAELAGEDEIAVGLRFGIGDGFAALEELDDSVLYQLYQFDPFPPISGGSEHLLM